MTEYKVGDKVRVEIEGVVEYASALTATIHVQDSQGNFAAQVAPESGVKITKLVDVPTKAGALLYPYSPDLYSPIVRDSEGGWIVLGRPSLFVLEDTVRSHLEWGNYYVAFEGVEE